MVSINNTAANSFVLASLRQTNADITTSQTRIGTGYKINGSSDNAALWSIAQSLRSDIKAADTLTANVSISKSRADVGVAALNKVSDLLTKMQEVSDATDAAATGAELTAATNKIKSYQAQITSLLTGAVVKGKNILTNSTADEKVIIGKDAAAANIELTYAKVDVSVSTTDLGKAVAGATTLVADVKAISGLAATAMSYVQGVQANLSSYSEGLDTQLSFQSSLNTIKANALSGIVDTDMEAESAKLTALQVKQQLAYQALAIGNSSVQNVLMLFR
ncbi:TPA: hypothetical protein VMX41_001783 [Streptococcus pyogenes]|nr:hypothetical protein [Streptococcus pyogenes]